MDPKKELGQLLKELRKDRKLTVAQLAMDIDKSESFIRLLERGERSPSKNVLEKIIECLVQNQDEIEGTKNKLLFLLAKIKSPLEISEDISTSFTALNKISMPEKFIKILKADLKETNIKKLPINNTIIEEVLAGRCVLPRDKVISLAKYLEKPIDQYLSSAGYMTNELEELMKKDKMAGIFTSLGRLTPEELDQTIGVIEKVVNIYNKDHKT